MKKRPHLDDLVTQESRLAMGVCVAFALAALSCSTPPGMRPQASRSETSERTPASATANAPPRSSAGAWTHYRVEPGDTAALIAACRGVTVRELARTNAIYDPNRLRVGWSLRVPALDLCHGPPASADANAAKARRPAAAHALQRAAAPAATAARIRAARLLAEARRQYDAADFEPALRGAEEATTALARAPRESSTDRRRAEGHLLAGMAAAGLEDRERAIAEFERAFALDPTARLAPDDRSPRLVELVEASRARHRAPGETVGRL